MSARTAHGPNTAISDTADGHSEQERQVAARPSFGIASKSVPAGIFWASFPLKLAAFKLHFLPGRKRGD